MERGGKTKKNRFSELAREKGKVKNTKRYSKKWESGKVKG